jgi:hypothetical protein
VLAVDLLGKNEEISKFVFHEPPFLYLIYV